MTKLYGSYLVIVYVIIILTIHVCFLISLLLCSVLTCICDFLMALSQDVTMKIMTFSQQGSRAICILSATGTISNVTLRQPSSCGGTLTYEVSPNLWHQHNKKNKFSYMFLYIKSTAKYVTLVTDAHVLYAAVCLPWCAFILDIPC